MTIDELKYCPRCAGALEPRAVEYPDVSHPVCRACGFVLWQNVKPTVEALILRSSGSQTDVLLGRRVADPTHASWDAPGGFLNAGDFLRTALQRECRREMGVDVRVGELVGAFEDVFCGIPIVSLVYACEIISGDPHPAPPIDEVRWFALDELPNIAYRAIREALDALKAR